MRRATAVVVAGLCAVIGCRGGAGQEPYDGAVVAPQAAPPAAQAAAAGAGDAEPMASEVDVPWSIALLSDSRTRPAKPAARPIVVDRASVAEEPSADEEPPRLQMVVDHAADEKPPTAKSCTGVVKGRS